MYNVNLHLKDIWPLSLSSRGGFNRPSYNVVLTTFTCVILQFTQSKDLCQILLDTKGTTLVEASPLDTIWGIGLTAKDPAAKYKATWKGKNLLGYALTDVREKILKEQQS
jgi:ribA/ribD-fused uncharacterized protein